MPRYVLDLSEIDRTQVALVGGKAANLGELSRIEGITVPAGFCVTTDAFRRIAADVPALDDELDRLSLVRPDDRVAIAGLSARIREMIEAAVVPDDVAAAILATIGRLGDQTACAVRSSATAEDLPTASFAGQQDTYLNVVGPAAILEHVRRCWASLFTERAVTYRARQGQDHRKARMAVVVQAMIFPEAAGILFTADPVTGNRTIASVEASFGLGEALVSGLVNPDIYNVQRGQVVARTIGSKQVAITALSGGGTQRRAVDRKRQTERALTDEQVVRLADLGRRIERHFGSPQDIEWCLVDDDFRFVQSRPITTLFPVPASDDDANRVYVSVGHQQMMTDAMKPLGLSFWQMTTARPMAEAGGRLFVDVTGILSTRSTRDSFLALAGKSDPLMLDALRVVLDRGEFVALAGDADAVEERQWTPPSAGTALLDPDPELVTELIRRSETSIAALKREIRTKSGSALFDFILADIAELRRILFDPESHRVFMTAIEATWWLNDHIEDWLGEKNAADALTQSVPHNVTSEMGLALLDVADVIRSHPDVVAFLERVDDDGFLDELGDLPGGREARDAIRGWLERYGMRCVGEIDITRPRWAERPTTLVPLLLGNVRNFQAGAAERFFEQGRQDAALKEAELLTRLRTLPDGARKAEETRRMIERVRTFIGYREYPKYGMVSRFFVYKLALLEEAERLVKAGVLRERDDIDDLRFEELRDVVRTNRADDQLIRERKDAFRSYESLTPPRVLTSDGEAIFGSHRRDDVPAGSLPGIGVSAGTVEGRARVILEMADADLDRGDILVTTSTDPSWTPLFVAISGLVTEVGGLMTHGAVIAREYGLPAVVGVVDAPRRIRNGQRIRVHGTDGYVELLPDEPT
jgi:phosphoenolpyruvate synthase/pyruvate phosphate dikinase